MIKKLIPRPIRKQLSRLPFYKSPVWWANFGPFSRYLADRIKPLSPPVVILSIPRSGSSWVGEILGISPTSLYLREPVTQTYIKKHGRGPVCFELDPENLPATYEASLNHVIKGLPVFPQKNTIFPLTMRYGD